MVVFAVALSVAIASAAPHANATKPKPQLVGVQTKQVTPVKLRTESETNHANEPGAGPLTIDEAWAQKLVHSDLKGKAPLTFRVLRYLDFYKEDAHGKSMLAVFVRRSGRYRDMIRGALDRRGMPSDLVWLAMVESGFDERARSAAGAAGLWQFMPDTAKGYGLASDRWIDQRMNVKASTEAAIDMFGDLYRKFGSWELAMAAYNMGPGALTAAIKRYNTNDYWTLCELEGAIPWETTLYVPKILAIATAARNEAAFGIRNLPEEAAAKTDEVSIPPGVKLSSVAIGTGVTAKDLEILNPELRLGLTPPGIRETIVRVPAGKGAAVMERSAALWSQTQESVSVQAGESLEHIAQRTRTPKVLLAEANQLTKSEPLREGTVLIVPKPATQSERLSVVVPPEVFLYPGRLRVFYRVLASETLEEIASKLHVGKTELTQWNALDPESRMFEGMTLQVFLAPEANVSGLALLREKDVRVLVAGSEDFFVATDAKNRNRVRVVAQSGDTLTSIGEKHKVSPSLMERINRRPRSEVLTPGTLVYAYVDPPGAAH
jgi:membrane-bound lytic murein transglycosylase D